MFKTDDGRLFTSLNEAVIHEQQTFVSAGMTPLLTALLSKFKPTEQLGNRILSDDTIALVVAEAVVNLAEDRAMIQEFQKLFAKLQLQPAVPVSRTRKRSPKKKKPAHHPAAPPIDPAAPAGDAGDTRVPDDTKPPFAERVPASDAPVEGQGVPNDPSPFTEQAPPPPAV